MNQSGWKLGGSITIDSLLYTYISNTNRLLNVIDRKNDTTTKLGDFRSSTRYMQSLGNNKTTSATDYTYDATPLLVFLTGNLSAMSHHTNNPPWACCRADSEAKCWISERNDLFGPSLPTTATKYFRLLVWCSIFVVNRNLNTNNGVAIISGLFLGSKLKLVSPDFLKE
jgi:hypothetical protein